MENVYVCEKILIKKVACGKNHTVALSTENELWVWGSGIALGIEPPTKTLKPKKVKTLIGRNVLDIICGEMYTVAVVERSVLDD
jgi:alpha-tubulin suppressor-like RCC1 family protein